MVKELVVKALPYIEVANFEGKLGSQSMRVIVYKITTERQFDFLRNPVKCQKCQEKLTESHIEYRLRYDSMPKTEYLVYFAACSKHEESLEEAVTNALDEAEELREKLQKTDPSDDIASFVLEALK